MTWGFDCWNLKFSLFCVCVHVCVYQCACVLYVVCFTLCLTYLLY